MITKPSTKSTNQIALTILLNQLSDEEKEELDLRLLKESQKTKCEKHFEESAHNNSSCPHCNSNHIVKIGKLNGNQKFKCK